MRELLINGDNLPMSDGHTDKFEVTVAGSDAVSRGCDGCPEAVNVCSAGLVCAVPDSGGT